MKFGKLLLTILVALLLIVVLTNYLEYRTPPMEVGVQAIGVRPLVPYLTHMDREVTSDNWSLLIDLSDSTNYPHARTNSVILKEMNFDGDLSAAEEWEIKVGVVTAVLTTGTDIEWIRNTHHVRATQFSRPWQMPEHGLNLSVSGGDLEFVATMAVTTTATITTTTEISTTVGVTGTVGVGDLILFLDEITGTATLHLEVSTFYDAE